MKRFVCIITALLLSLCITACNTENEKTDTQVQNRTNDNQEETTTGNNKKQTADNSQEQSTDHSQKESVTDYTMSTVCNKDSVDEFMSILGEVEGDGLLSGFVLDEKNCYNVTPLSVANETDIKIFKFSDSCASFALIDGGVYEICTSFGGFGFVNAVPWDYDEDGNLDLLIASSWGSGMYRSEISVFNTKTKESTILFESTSDLLVGTAVSPALSSKDINDLPIWYEVYSAKQKQMMII